MNDIASPVELLVCVKCRARDATPTEGERPGLTLYNELAAQGMPDGVTLRPVECLQNCDNGCSVAMRGGDHRWSYIYGNLDAGEGVPLLLTGIALYQQTSDGLIPWRQRPEHFKRNCVARLPPLRDAEPTTNNP